MGLGASPRPKNLHPILLFCLWNLSSTSIVTMDERARAATWEEGVIIDNSY